MDPIISFGADGAAFRIHSDELVNELVSDCAVGEFAEPEGDISDLVPFQALWDTGATNSVITDRVVRECGLTPTGQTRVQGVNGAHRANTYVVNILLHGIVLFPSVVVTEGDFLGADVLIGMDIINKGDFAVTNKDDKTLFTYRFPSEGGVDFVGWEEDDD